TSVRRSGSPSWSLLPRGTALRYVQGNTRAHYGQDNGRPPGPRCATLGRPVWLMMMARACCAPRLSQKTIVPLTIACTVGRNTYSGLLDVMVPPSHGPYAAMMVGSASERALASSRGVSATTIHPAAQGVS